MPEVEFVPLTDDEILKMEPAELEARRRFIVSSANGNHENLSEEALHELVTLTATMRNRARSGAPKSKVKVDAPKGPKKSLDDLLGAI